MKCTIKYFAAAGEAAGKHEEEYTLPAAATVGALREQLASSYPALRKIPLRMAVNCSFVGDECALADGDEVALIPPVAGG